MQPIRALLHSILQSEQPSQSLQQHAYRGFTEDEKRQLISQGHQVYAGKVRELIVSGQEIAIYHSDRLSAFDRFIGYVPYKGSILAAISDFWLREAERIMPTHLLGQDHERVLRCRSLKPLKVEVVVRGYMAGSMMRAYEKGVREFCGVRLPEGLKPFAKLPYPIITPTSKAAAFEHDVEVSPEELIASGVCSEQQWQKLAEMALQLFALGQSIYDEKSWILVDTKYEFGIDDQGKIFVIDEIHTPDSSRLWLKSSYDERLKAKQAPEMLDKENVRRYLLDLGFSGYGEVPEVPAHILISLAETYLNVAETLLGKTLMSHGPLKRSPLLG